MIKYMLYAIGQDPLSVSTEYVWLIFLFKSVSTAIRRIHNGEGAAIRKGEMNSTHADHFTWHSGFWLFKDGNYQLFYTNSRVQDNFRNIHFTFTFIIKTHMPFLF